MEDKIVTLVVFGTRAEAIKMAPLIKELTQNDLFTTKICVTGQHRELLDVVIKTFDIKIDYDLNIMSECQDLLQVACRVIEGVGKIVSEIKPNLLLVQGDTSSAFVAALVGFYHKIKVFHIEAGMRSFNDDSPFPEEMHRKLIAQMASGHFAPTETAKNNLLREGVDKSKIYITGNTIIDVLDYTIDKEYKFKTKELDTVDFSKKIILVTTHRRENWLHGIKDICMAINQIIEENDDTIILYLVHPNPLIRKVINDNLIKNKRIIKLNQLETREMHNLLNRSYFIMTDSGGLQEEAAYLKKPALILRDATERKETIDAGIAKVVGTDKNTIIEEVKRMLRDSTYYRQMCKTCFDYGNGHASQAIVDSIINCWMNERGI